MVAFDQTPANLTQAASNLFALITDRNIFWYPSAEIQEAVLNAAIVETPRGNGSPRTSQCCSEDCGDHDGWQTCQIRTRRSQDFCGYARLPLRHQRLSFERVAASL
jgi:hypothetical protein